MSAAKPAETFAQRGVAVPFTSPMMAAGRVRSARQGGIELVLPNPAGARGVMVIDIVNASRQHGATLHDTVLCRRLADLGRPTPRAVRITALSVAAEGHAGPAAAAAAQARLRVDANALTRTRAALLSPFPGGTEAAAAASLGVPQHSIRNAVRSLSAAIIPVGLANDNAAYMPRVIAALDRAGGDITDWVSADPAHDPDGIGKPVGTMLRDAAAMGAAFLTGLRRHLADPGSTLQRVVAQRALLVTQIDRAVWLMDGWERLALLWQAAVTPALRRLALLEIAQGQPLLPIETLSWKDPGVTAPAADPQYRISYGGDARLPRSVALTLVRRNEALRAMCL